MKLIKKILLSVALCGIGCSVHAQVKEPNPYDNLRPWVDDSTKALTKVFYTGEWGGFLGEDATIERNAAENKVSKKYKGERYDSETRKSYETSITETWTYTENRNLGWVLYKKEEVDSLGNLLAEIVQTRVLADDGKVLKEEEISRDLKTEISDTIKSENGVPVYMTGYTQKMQNDTTVFTADYGGVKMYDKNGKLIYDEIPQILRFSYGYNSKGQQTWYRNESWNAEKGAYETSLFRESTYNDAGVLTKIEQKQQDATTGELIPSSQTVYIFDEKGLVVEDEFYTWNATSGEYKYKSGTEYGYDSKNRLIMIRAGREQRDYVYDDKGNLTLAFFFETSNYYGGNYMVCEYEGGEKKYEAFDASKYPTDSYPANSPVAQHGKLQVSGKNIVDVNGEVVVLKGISTHDIFWMKSCYKESAIDAMVDDWGINVFRIASYAEEYVKSESEGNNRKAFIDELVDICAQKGVYCIIDWHVLNKGTNDPWTVIDEAKEFFDYMSKTHAGKAHVMYELCNEPNGDVSWARIKSYAQEVIDVIVKNDPNSIIITGTPVWSQRVIAAADSPLDYPNSMYTLHFYADTHKEDLREHADQAIAKGCPIFVSEFGTCNSSGNGGFNPTESVKWFKWMKENNISWANWSWADKKETASILKPGSCGSDMWHRFTGSGALIHWALTNSELSGEDSIKLAAKAYEKDTYLSYIKERIDYVGECIAENPSLLEEGDVAALIDCAYRKDCEKEDPALSQEENYDRLASCIKDKKSSVNVVPQLWGVSAYPNPVSDVLTVDYVGSDYVVSLIDVKGVTVLNQECENGRTEINVSYLAPGAYLLKVESNGKYYLEKIQKN